jgi:hypothetical protein
MRQGHTLFHVSHQASVQTERGVILRAGGLPGLSGVLQVARAWKLYQNPFGFDGASRALVQSSAGALQEFCEF